MAFKRRQRTYNPKRRLVMEIDFSAQADWQNQVSYGGNPEHKRNPGDFGLTPPSDPRPGKMLCDDTGIITRQAALSLLQKGLSAGLYSSRMGHGDYWPQNIWAVTETGLPMEAQLENPAKGTYHGYPMPEQDPFREEVLKRWEQRDAHV
ncbi:hypothetical protein [Ectothiorhodospira shaposhnikovii]|uniref:hypothetical protein n=1 Tax=Ectothiorhodospira shaposhnikovii TaxID=1054 RepID=UPI0039A1BEBD